MIRISQGSNGSAPLPSAFRNFSGNFWNKSTRADTYRSNGIIPELQQSGRELEVNTDPFPTSDHDTSFHNPEAAAGLCTNYVQQEANWWNSEHTPCDLSSANAACSYSSSYPPEWVAYWDAHYPGWNTQQAENYRQSQGLWAHTSYQPTCNEAVPYYSVSSPHESSSDPPQSIRPPTRRSATRSSAASRAQTGQQHGTAMEGRTAPHGVQADFSKTFRSVPSRLC